VSAKVVPGSDGASSSGSSAAGSSSGGQARSSSFWSSRTRGDALGFMDRVCVTLQVQKQHSSDPLQTRGENGPDYVVETRAISNDFCYK
jgi:hypothetical protein